MFTFEQPLLLLFLIPIALLVYFTWRNMSLPFPRRQRVAILATRLLLFTLIIGALAGTAWAQPVTRQGVVFVGDISDSTQVQRSFIESWIRSALQHKRPGDQVGIVAVGRNALVEQAVKSDIDFTHFQSTPDTNYTDLAAGLRLAAAILPPDSLRRIVLLSDGQQNLEDALQEGRLLQQQGIRLDIVPLPSTSGVEARINGLSAPTNLRTNERFTLHMNLYSTIAQSAILHLYLDQTLIAQPAVPLVGGEQEVSLDLPAPPPGFHTFTVDLIAPHDTILQNNKAAVFVNVQGPPNVLIVEGERGNGHNIAAALQATGINATTTTPGDLPSTLDGLAAYSSVILADVPAVELGEARMLALQAYVRDLGRGLVVSGGQNSYGVGGYAGTPLEETLPVRMDIPQHKDSPTIAVVLIIESLESQEPINISKEAAKGVISLLTPRDQVAISEGCGGIVIPMQHVTDKTALDKQIDNMEPCDPPSYNPDFIAAEKTLTKTDAKIKHVIMLGDGDATDNYAPQILKMAGENITVSTVATNADDAGSLGIMQQIAGWGKGRYYNANDPSAIPQILLKETQQAARRAVINDPFTPAVVGSHPIMTGLTGLPELDGYVATTPKAAAQLILVSHLDDPVLAGWQYGLGRSVAWTSDALGLWTSHWLTWDEAARWWANVVTWSLPSPDSALNINGTITGDTGQLTVDLPSGTNIPAGASQQMQANIITPAGTRETITLNATAPQRWQGSFPAAEVGAFLIQITYSASTQGSTHQLRATTGFVVPYSPEYHSSGTDTHFLKQLAQAGGGALLGSTDFAAAFAQNLAPAWAALPIVFLLLTLAALLLPIDIALRRLSGLDFLLEALHWLKTHLTFQRRIVPEASPRGEGFAGLDTLRTSREARHSRTGPVKAPVVPKVAKAEKVEKVEKVETPVRVVEQPKAPVLSAAAKAPAKEEKTPEQSTGMSMAQQLLEAKRKRAKGR